LILFSVTHVTFYRRLLAFSQLRLQSKTRENKAIPSTLRLIIGDDVGNYKIIYLMGSSPAVAFFSYGNMGYKVSPLCCLILH